MKLGLRIGFALLGIGILFVAEACTSAPPTRSTPTTSVLERAQTPTHATPSGPVRLFGNPTADIRLVLTIGPDAQNPDTITVKALDAQNKPLAKVQRIILQFMYLEEDTALQTIIAEPNSAGSYIVKGSYLPLDGMWRMRVTVRQQGQADAAVDFPLYRPPTNPVTTEVPAARQLLQRAQTRMNQLTALRSRQELNDGTNAVVVSEYEFAAPDKLRLLIQGQGESIGIGDTQYLRSDAGPWSTRPRLEPVVFPHFDFASQAQNVRLGRVETLDRVPAQIVRFEIPTATGDEQVQYAYWIANDDGRVLQFAMLAPAHFMMERYADFDGQDIVIRAPADLLAQQPPAAPTQPSAVLTDKQGSALATPRRANSFPPEEQSPTATATTVAAAPPTPISRGLVQTRRFDDLTATIQLDPHVFEPTTVEIRLTNAKGQPASDIARVDVAMAMQGMNHGAFGIEANKTAPGVYQAKGMVVVMAGPWYMALRIARADGTLDSAVLAFDAPTETSPGTVGRFYTRPPGAVQIEDIAVYPQDILPNVIRVQAGQPVRLEIMYVDNPFCALLVKFPAQNLNAIVSRDGLAELGFTPTETGTLTLSCTADGLLLQSQAQPTPGK